MKTVLPTSTPRTKVTIRDVAKSSGFSASTVSIVLNNAPLAKYIPETSKTKIHVASKKLGYRPNIFAQSLRKQRTHSIGVMVFDITDPYCTLILRGIDNALFKQSFVPVLADVQNNRDRFEQCLERLLDRHIEGLIVVANWLFVDVDLLADLEQRSIPTVMIGRQLQNEGVSSVLVDNQVGGFLAFMHVFELGHRDIAVIRGPKGLADSKLRWQGIERAAKKCRMTINPKLVIDLPNALDPNSGFEGGCQATLELLKRNRPFTALITFDDVTAFGAIRALTMAGLRVPRDCSVIGFDDIPPARLFAPALTTVRQPMVDLGAIAVGILTEEISANVDKRAFVAAVKLLRPEVVARDSTARRRP